MIKADARRLALERRNESTTETCSVVDFIINNGLIKNYDRIGIYYPIGKEIDITKLKAYYPNKSFFLPVTRKEIYFAEYVLPLAPGKFKTMEPTGQAVERDSIDCFIIPCVAIGKDNKRIGYGKGYYDRYLENYKGMKIGVCYRNAIFNDCECDQFDVSLDIVVEG